MEKVAQRTILLVEDEPALSGVLAKFLKNMGYKSIIKDTGAGALDYAANNKPDAVITDIHLPDLNGLVLTQKLRDRFGQDTPIIVLSGDTSMEVLRSLHHVGATHFFNKPFNPELLKAHLDECFAEKKPG